MKFNGKELFNLGVPPAKIKFFVNKEFESEESLLKEALQDKPKSKRPNDDGTWFQWIWDTFPHLPMEVHGDAKNGVPVKMSKSKLRRYMDQSAIHIDDTPVDSKKIKDKLPKNITWFPKSKERKVTW